MTIFTLIARLLYVTFLLQCVNSYPQGEKCLNEFFFVISLVSEISLLS